MPAATTLLAGAGAATSLVGGISKAISGGKQKREARKAARRFKRQELKNAHAGRRVSTAGAKLALEEQARGTATSIDTLKSGGIRGAIGGVGAVQEANIRGARAAGADIDRQQVGIDKDFANDEARIRSIKEARDNQDLANIQAQLNAGAQTQASGFGDVAQTGFAAASYDGFGTPPPTTPASPQQTVAPNVFGVDPQNALFAPAQGNRAMNSQLIDPLTGQPYYN